MKKHVCSIGLLLVLTLLTSIASAMVNPEIIQWGTSNKNDYIISVFQAALGRNPYQDEWNATQSMQNEMQIFWAVINSPEYKKRFGYLSRVFEVKWKTRGHRERGICHCYYYTKNPDTGFLTSYPTQLNSGVARALVTRAAYYDKDTCPGSRCGKAVSGSQSDDVLPIPKHNLIKDAYFGNFGNHSGPWGVNVQYAKNGIWWESKNPHTTAKTVRLNGGNVPTALHISHKSPPMAHRYGTTAQRIRVTKGAKYRISFYAKTQNMASNGAITITIDPAWKIRPINMTKGTYEWRKFSGTFTAPNNYVDLRIISQDAHSTLITDIQMTRE